MTPSVLRGMLLREYEGRRQPKFFFLSFCFRWVVWWCGGVGVVLCMVVVVVVEYLWGVHHHGIGPLSVPVHGNTSHPKEGRREELGGVGERGYGVVFSLIQLLCY